MMKLLKVIKTYWALSLIVLVAPLIITSTSFAQTASTSAGVAQKYGVTFPIKELGDCTDINSCKSFCDDPVNKDSCIAFAKSKGFYHEDELTTQKDTILAKAKAVLGCNSETSCLNFCSISTNRDKCSSFAQTNNLQGGVVSQPDNQSVLTQAQQVLGCNSEQTCKTFCEQDANRNKCADFAHQVGLRGGEQQVGPGGCTSEQTCQTFCSNPNNFQVCASFSQRAGANFSGPGGCNSPESCKSYCQQNPNSCQGFSDSGQGPQSGSSPAEMCDRTPNCSWTGSTCFCGSTGSNNSTNINDQSSECSRYGCKWTGNSCQCANVGSSYNTSVYSGTNMSYSQQEAGCKAGGGTCADGSTSNFCNCQGYQNSNYSPAPSNSSSPVPSNSYGNPNQGYSTSNGPATYAQQEATCKGGGGTCGSGSTSTYCSCQGYHGTPPGSNYYPTNGSCQPPSGGCGPNSYYDYSRCGCYQSSGPYPTSGSASCQPPSGGCGANSYYDYGRCGCYQNPTQPNTTSSSGSCTLQPPSSGCGSGSAWDQGRCGCYPVSNSTQPAPTSAPQPTQSSSSAPQPTQASAPAPTSIPQTQTSPSAPTPAPSVKGISTKRSIWDYILDFFPSH